MKQELEVIQCILDKGYHNVLYLLSDYCGQKSAI